MVRYAILGPVELRDGELRTAVGGPRQVALLALLVNANRALSSDSLIDALWSDQGPSGAIKRLQVAIGRLRRTLDGHGAHGESVLQTTAGGYLLAVAPGELDAEVFQAQMEGGCRALDAAVEARVDAELQLGEHGSLIGELEALVAAHPWRERLAAQLMLAMYRCGRQGAALEVYARTRAYLSDELGLEPGPALQALQAKILTQSAALQRTAPPPAAPAAAAVAAPAFSAGPLALALPRALQQPVSSPFVGREAQLERLRARWSDARDGSHAVVVMGGEAGIGKTRLASELACSVHAQGALVLYGRCDEGLAVPYQPFVEALRPYARAAGPDRLGAELGHLAPELRRLLPELTALGEPIRADPESERFGLFEAVAALIEIASREQPVLLVIDDLHWAAPPTLLALRDLIRSERSFSALVIGTYRETELDVGHPLAQLLADLHRDVGVQLLSLDGLDERAIAEMVRSVDGGDAHERPGELAQRLRSETAGNPFFVRELLAHLVESGALAGDADWREPGARRARRARAAAARDRQPRRAPVARRAGRAARRRGRRVDVLAGAAGRVLNDMPGLLDALDEAVGAGLLTEAGHGEYVFGHALVRQTLYRALSSARRMRLHGQLGAALEASGAAHARVELLAHHFAEAAPAGQADKAADYALAASANAMARLGYEEAIGHCERGLEALEVAGVDDDARRCELLLALAESCSSAGAIDRARRTCIEAAELAEGVGDDERLARAALGYCGPLFFSIGAATTEPSVDLLQRALARLGESDSALRAQLMGRPAAALAYAGGEHRRPQLRAAGARGRPSRRRPGDAGRRRRDDALVDPRARQPRRMPRDGARAGRARRRGRRRAPAHVRAAMAARPSARDRRDRGRRARARGLAAARRAA